METVPHYPIIFLILSYPARAAVGVAALPRGARVQMDAVLVLE